MTSSFLLPPNIFSLSDTVIGGVVQRVAPLHDNNFDGHKRQFANVETDNLPEEIKNLESQRQLIIHNARTDQSVWPVATEYFRLFRHGYMTPIIAPDSSSVTPTKTMRQNVQLDFLETKMAADVTDGTICGAEAILQNWRLFSVFHGDVNVQLKRLQQVAADSLLATMAISLTITKNTLHQLYPHLVSDDQVSPLAVRLLNQRIVVCGSMRFVWDEASGRVARLDSKLDMMTPILKIVGSLENVATVFGQALITPEGKFFSSL
ncbi:hypothetical protein GQ600_10818 [Phytophthora cactorum]|nr:hypothetical protein GQ600_10818 [Phytophthora cactorum]